MTPSRAFVLLVYAALAVAVIAVGASYVNPSADSAPEQPSEPVLASFTSGGGTCVDAVDRRSATTVRSTDEATVVIISGNVSVPDANYVLDTPDLVREGPGEYVLDLTASEATEKAEQNCTAQASYELRVQIPPAAEPVSLTVRDDGEFVTRVSSGNASRTPSGTAVTVENDS